jgi:hypothetical protein
MKFFTLLAYSLLIIYEAFAYQYDVSICCIFQDEGRFLKEWIDYHRLIGVQHFYMYDNESTDDSRAILEPYINAGIIDYIFWDQSYNSPEGWWHVQRNAYIDAFGRATGNSKWLCIIDTDEFIVPLKDRDIKTFLNDFDSYGGVYVNWIFYGTSGIKRIPEESWMITCLLHRADLSFRGHTTGKSFVQPERVDPQKSFFPHICAYRENFYHVNPSKKRLKKGESKDICIDRIRLHHYWCRDIDFMERHKFPRYERWYGTQKALEKMSIEAEMNAHFDPLIVNVIDRIRSEQDH